MEGGLRHMKCWIVIPRGAREIFIPARNPTGAWVLRISQKAGSSSRNWYCVAYRLFLGQARFSRHQKQGNSERKGGNKNRGILATVRFSSSTTQICNNAVFFETCHFSQEFPSCFWLCPYYLDIIFHDKLLFHRWHLCVKLPFSVFHPTDCITQSSRILWLNEEFFSLATAEFALLKSFTEVRKTNGALAAALRREPPRSNIYDSC